MNGECYFSEGLSPTLTTNKGEGSKVAIPVLTPERANKRQNGRRFKEDGEEAFTLTAQDRHGVAVCVEDFYQSRPVRTYDQEAPTLRSDRQGLKVAMDVSPVGIIDDQGRLEKKCTITDTVPTLRSETHGNLPKVVESVDISPEVIGGIGEKNFGKQWRQGNRIYDGEKIATALEAHPVGNTGGNTNLYAVEIEPLEMSGHEVSESEDESHALNCNDQRKIFGEHQTRTMVGYNATLKRGGGITQTAMALNARDYKGLSGSSQMMTAAMMCLQSTKESEQKNEKSQTASQQEKTEDLANTTRKEP